jgi:hypothetical protein
MTQLWFIIWLIVNTFGSRTLSHPVNGPTRA